MGLPTDRQDDRASAEVVADLPERLTKGIGQRISTIRAGLSQSEFAESIMVHKNTISRYERELTVPDAEALARICERYSVNPVWLLTGSGPRHDIGGLLAHGECPLDETLLRDALLTVEQVMDEAERCLPAEKKAQLIHSIYELFRAHGKDLDKRLVQNLIRAAS